MIIRVRRYLKSVKGRIFSVGASTRTINKTVSQGPFTPLRGMADMKPKGLRRGGTILSQADKNKLAKKGLERSRLIQDARARALGWRVK